MVALRVTANKRCRSQNQNHTEVQTTIQDIINELLELKKQSYDLLSRGYIRPSKSLFKALVFFVDKKVASYTYVSVIGP